MKKKLTILILIVIFAVLPYYITPPCRPVALPLEPPSTARLLGTDAIGRDALCLTLKGLWVSISTGIAALAAYMLVGFVGLAAGYTRHASIATLISMTAGGLPRLALLLLLSLITRLNSIGIGLLIGVLDGLHNMAAMASRAEQVSKKPFIETSVASGASATYILIRHVAPETWDLILSTGSVTAARAVYAEAGLSLLGLGDPSEPSLGRLVHLVLATPGAILTTAGLIQVFTALLLISLVALVIHYTLATNTSSAHSGLQ